MSSRIASARLRAHFITVHVATSTDELAGNGPLLQARQFLLAQLLAQSPLPYWADTLQEFLALASSPSIHWEDERESVLSGLQMLNHQWRQQIQQ
jgi:hypothetical protein